MKRTHSGARLASLLAALACLSISVCVAADTNSTAPTNIAVQPADASTQAPTQTAFAAPKLPYGVEDVVKLSRAQVGDEITINYIRNSGTIYTLGPQEIVYLRSQGVSDNVINAMIDQRKVVAQATPAPQAPVIANAPQVPNAAVAPDYSQVAPVYSEQPASTVYVMPPPTYSYPYYYYGYPYYYGGPVISFGFGWGGYYGYHGYYGHSHGGYYHGGYGHGGGGHWGGHH